jgi:hypothetical protein
MYLVSFFMLCLLIMEWRRLRWAKKKALARWMMFAVLGVSWGIWMYLSMGEPLFHPAKWVSDQLEPYSPQPYE